MCNRLGGVGWDFSSSIRSNRFRFVWLITVFQPTSNSVHKVDLVEVFQGNFNHFSAEALDLYSTNYELNQPEKSFSQ